VYFAAPALAGIRNRSPLRDKSNERNQHGDHRRLIVGRGIANGIAARVTPGWGEDGFGEICR
jgi:hypothetical protein